jgi:hypothetical protein
LIDEVTARPVSLDCVLLPSLFNYNLMETTHVKKVFHLFVPLEWKAEPNFRKTDEPFGFCCNDKPSELYIVKLFCKQRTTSTEYEEKDWLSWAKTAFILKPLTAEQPQSGLLLQLKIKQGVLDFRKIKKRFIRLQVECTNSEGQILNIATSEFFQLLPRIRNSNTFEDNTLCSKFLIFKKQYPFFFLMRSDVFSTSNFRQLAD